MNELTLHLSLLFILLAFAAFFAGSETAMMSINRYKLKHLAKIKGSAKRVQTLLARPDRLLGMILLGNTFVNIFAGAVATLIAVDFFGEQTGAVVASGALTILMLIFCEVTPKTVAVLYPEKIALPCSFPLQLLIWLFYPIVWTVNILSNGLLRIFGISMAQAQTQGFSREELRTIVNETTGRLPTKHRKMLLSILDLEKVSVDDIMIPRNDVVGLDLENEWQAIVSQLSNTQHTFLPVYQTDLNNLIGVLHAKKALQLLLDVEFNEEKLRKALDEPIFVPQGSSLTTQMINFQRNKERFALIVDEYGDIKGLITMEDILEEIVGEFTTTMADIYTMIHAQGDGSYIVDGSVQIREFNRVTHMKLPLEGPKTLNGLILEQLQSIPEVGTCCLIGNIPIEVIHVQENRVKTIMIFPPIPEKEPPSGE